MNDEPEPLAEQARASCICVKGRTPTDYDGPDRDCPMHGEGYLRMRAATNHPKEPQ